MKHRGSFQAPQVTLHTPTADTPLSELRFTVTVSSSRLYDYPRSSEQLGLLRQVVYLREVMGMTFNAIAATLTAQGLASPRGRPLSAELVYSIYKKRPASQR